MGRSDLQPIPFKSLPPLFLRLLPTIYEYVRLTAVDGTEVGPVARQLYVSHLKALTAFLSTTAQIAEIDPQIFKPLIYRCNSMATRRGDDLIRVFGDLIEGMQAAYATKRDQVQSAIADDPDLFRELYSAEVKPKSILAVYAEETWDRSEKMEATLTNCWYDCRCHCESEGVVWVDDVDVVLFAPGQQLIHANIENIVAKAKIPVLVLAGWSKQEDPEDMAELRTEFWYRRSGYRVLHGPFPAIKLYQAIDGLHVHHLASRRATVRSMAATAR
ncbi:MAG: hypothetical protein GY835_01930 [bacterium]|nr:hypothetical protein [bacterium]